MKCALVNTLLGSAVLLFLVSLAADFKAGLQRKAGVSALALLINPFRLFKAELYNEGAHRWRRLAIRLNLLWMFIFVIAGLVLFYFPNDGSEARCFITPPLHRPEH